MPSRLILKELRETIWIAAIAVAVYLYCAVTVTGINMVAWGYIGTRGIIPFVQCGFVASSGFVSACLAIALGLRQTYGESVFGTYPFLLHRPVSRPRLIGSKLLVGLALYLVCSALPILLYACWAATPGTHASPFEWSMTVPCWNAWISITILYLAAFLSGVRPARWRASRLLPLAGLGGLIVLLVLPPWWSLRLPGLPGWSIQVAVLGFIVLLDVLLVLNILFVARTRDF